MLSAPPPLPPPPAPAAPQPQSFELDLDTTKFGDYTRGGLVTQYKPPKTMAFKSLAEVRAVHGG